MQIVPKFTKGLSTEFVKYTITYADFAVALTSTSINFVVIPPKGYIVNVVAKVTTEFTGGGATSVTADMGTTYLGPSSLIIGYDVFSTPSDTVWAQGPSTGGSPIVQAVQLFSFGGGGEQVTISLTSDVDLDTLTQGSMDVYLKLGQLP